MKHERPAEQDIANLIAPAFDRLPAPDSRRLAAIEQRLLASARPRRRAIAWWWLAAALAAGAASALWWAVDYDSGKGQEAPVPAVTPPSVAPSVADQPARPHRSEGAESKPASEPAEKHSPLIFKQER
jgi:hypothetical protein